MANKKLTCDNIIIRDLKGLTFDEARKAFEAALGYENVLNEHRTAKDPKVAFGKHEVHETRTGTLVVNLRKKC